VNRVLFPLGLAALLAGWAGCVTPPARAPAAEGVPAPAEATADATALGSSETFVALDPAAAAGVAVAALAAHARPDGRLEVLVSLRNATAAPLRLSVACYFKTAAGLGTGEALVWRPLALAGNATETLRFTAAGTQAERFTLAARGAR
jgi:hypothetical protein